MDGWMDDGWVDGCLAAAAAGKARRLRVERPRGERDLRRGGRLRRRERQTGAGPPYAGMACVLDVACRCFLPMFCEVVGVLRYKLRSII